MIKNLLLPFVIVIGLSGCASLPTWMGGDPAQELTISQTSFEMQTKYTELAAIVVKYVEKARCTTVVLIDCAEQRVVDVLKDANRGAYTALRSAEIARGTPDENLQRELALKALRTLEAELVRQALKGATQ